MQLYITKLKKRSALINEIWNTFKIITVFLLLVNEMNSLNAQPLVSTDSSPATYEIEGRTRNGNSGFEGALFTSVTPPPGAPGGGQWQMNPSGAPIWNTNGNVYGDIHCFQLTYDVATGTTTWNIDFNRDGDYYDVDEMVSIIDSSLEGVEFKYLNIYVQGHSSGLVASVTDFTINGYNMGNFSSCSETATSVLFEEQSGNFSDIVATGNFSFSGGANHERPRIWVRLGDVVATDTIAPSPDLANLPTLRGECDVTVSTIPTATDNEDGLIIGTTTDSLTYNAQGTYTITWSYQDISGNISTQQQEVIVDDISAPEPDSLSLPTIIGVCSVTVTTAPTATDYCEGSIVATTTDPLSYSTPGIYTINWIYDDGFGNTAIQTQDIQVLPDLVLDSVSLSNVIDTCLTTVTTVPTATNQCTSAVIIGTTTDSLTYDTPGTYTITWNFDDGFGNTVTQQQKVVILTIQEDFNGDGRVETSDFLRLLAIFGTTCTCPEDLTGDSVVDTNDFLKFLVRFDFTCTDFF